MNNPNAVANLKPFQPGQRSPRASAATFRAMTMARKHSPEAMQFCIDVLRDAEQPVTVRLKAAEVILDRGAPKPRNPQDEQQAPGINFLEVVFVRPGETPPVIEPKPNGNGTFSVSFDEPA